MVSTDYTAPAAVTQTPPIVGELQRLFDSLDDSRLVGELIGPTRRGPKGHSVEAIWRAFVTKHHMGLPTTRALIGTLENNPWIAEACGFDWPNIPHEATFSRFFKRLSTPKFLPRVKLTVRQPAHRGASKWTVVEKIHHARDGIETSHFGYGTASSRLGRTSTFFQCGLATAALFIILLVEDAVLRAAIVVAVASTAFTIFVFPNNLAYPRDIRLGGAITICAGYRSRPGRGIRNFYL